MRGIVYGAKGDSDKAIADYTEAIRLDPKRTDAYFNRGSAWAHKKDYDKAVADYTEAIRLNPKDGNAFNSRGITYFDMGEFPKAITDHTEAIRLDPKYTRAYLNRGVAYDAKGDFPKAITDYTEAIRLNSKYTLAYLNRAGAYKAMKDYGKAIADYSEAIRLDPKDADTFNTLAWVCATCPDAKHRDGKKAVELATKACELTMWKNPKCLDTLAAAYAEAEDFVKAIEYVKKALDDETLPKESRDEVRERLKLYEAKKPYREPPKK